MQKLCKFYIYPNAHFSKMSKINYVPERFIKFLMMIRILINRWNTLLLNTFQTQEDYIKKTLPINNPLGRYHSRKRSAFWDMVIFWQGIENDVKKNIKVLTSTVTLWNFFMATPAFYFSNWSLGSKIRNVIKSAFSSGNIDIKQTPIKSVKRIISSTQGRNIK